MSLELPDGITLNHWEEDPSVIEIPYEIIDFWSCNNCELKFEIILLGENGRHQGQIKICGAQKITWQGPLPKKRDRAVEMLKELLQKRVDFHNERH